MDGFGERVDEAVADLLAGLDLREPSRVGLLDCALASLGANRIATIVEAERLGARIDLASLERIPYPERDEIKSALARIRFLAEDGEVREPIELTRAEIGEETTEAARDEARRAAFAPPSALLARGYAGAGLAFFLAARSQSGYRPRAATLRDWRPFRWLVADDVGLGKTIECGLSLMPLMASGRVKRALILAPAKLVPQWRTRLKEMFDLRFQQYVGAADNPRGDFWATADKVVASLQTLRDDRRGARARLLEAEPWDVVVVDEAHHRGARASRPCAPRGGPGPAPTEDLRRDALSAGGVDRF